MIFVCLFWGCWWGVYSRRSNIIGLSVTQAGYHFDIEEIKKKGIGDEM